MGVEFMNQLLCKKSKNPDDESVFSLKFARASIYCYLLFILILLPTVTYLYLKESQNLIRYSRFDVTADDTEQEMRQFFAANFDTMNVMSNIFGTSCPTAADWPNCTMPIDSFQKVATAVTKITSMNTLRVAPIVYKDGVSAFESFAFDYFASQGYPYLGTSPLGKVMIGRNLSDLSTYYHTTEEYPNGKYPIFAPVMFTGDINSASNTTYMFNMYTEPVKVGVIDQVFDCVNTGTRDCYGISDDTIRSVRPDPAVILTSPIFPSEESSSNIVGLVVVVVHWLEALAAEHEEGLNIIISSPEAEYTYVVKDGAAQYSGVGDQHDPQYSKYGHAFQVISPAVTGGVHSHTITVYPSDDYGDDSDHNTPLYACISVIFILISCIVAVLWYDSLVNKQSHERKLVSKTKRLFVRYISHEIRTPLNTVHVGLMVLRDEMKHLLVSMVGRGELQNTLSSWLELLGEIEESSSNATSVLSDLITYDKILTNTLQLEYSAIPFVEKVESILKLFNIQIREKRIKLYVNVEIIDGSDMVSMDNVNLSKLKHEKGEMQKLLLLADDVKIGQVLKNLLSNALKFTPEGGAVTVIVRWDKYVENTYDEDFARSFKLHDLGLVSVVVQDSGVGMAPNEVANLFQEGVQFKPNQHQSGQGSGLGLWVSKGFVEQHHGTLTASSEGMGKGSQFVMTLPVFCSTEKKPAMTLVDVAQQGRSSAYNTLSCADPDAIAGSSVEHLPLSINTITDPLHSSENATFNNQAQSITSVNNIHMGEEGYGSYVSKNGGSYVPVATTQQDADKLNSLCDTLSSSPPTNNAQLIPKRALNVLVVDDAASNRKVLCRLLRNNGFQCSEASDGAECVKMMQQCEPEDSFFDLILMDYEMPVMNGPMATQKIRNMGHKLPIFGVTGNVMNEDTTLFIMHGADVVLHKPLSIQKLLKALNDMSSTSRADESSMGPSSTMDGTTEPSAATGSPIAMSKKD